MIRILYFQPDGQISTQLSPDDIQTVLDKPEGVLWVDFLGDPPEKDEPILEQVFHFHPLAVDDALKESHVPKLDDWEHYLYIVLHAVYYDRTVAKIDVAELDVFLGKHYIVTHHDQPIQSLERIWDISQRDPRHYKLGADHLLYKLSDELVSDFMHTVEELDEEIDLVEDEVFDRPTSDILQRIFNLKRASLRLRRSLSPLREVFNKLARDEYPVIDKKDRVYFRDVYDHLVRLHDISESLRDLVGGVLDTYLSVINNRMSEVMKTLTIITTLFMPLSFLAGFFGMNFFLPEHPITAWMRIPVFVIVLALMVLVPVIMFAWIRKRGWM